MEGIAPSRSRLLVHLIFSHKVLVTSIILILCAIGGYLGLLYWSETVPKDIDFKVEQTDTIHTIAQRLRDDGIIKHRAFFYASYYLFSRHVNTEPGVYRLSSTMPTKDMVHTLESRPTSKSITIPAKASKEDIARLMTETLGWSALDLQFFSHTYAGMQWQQYQEHIKSYFEKKYAWNQEKTHTFLTLSALYYDSGYDFLKNMYVPGTYEIPLVASRAQAAGILIDRFSAANPDPLVALEKHIDADSAKNVVSLLEDRMVLMPDIVTIAPQDITLKHVGGRTYLLFTTSYWNKGRGPLEFIPDPKTRGVKGEQERTVFQRIYHIDGDYTEHVSGTFLWHDPHLYYHFKDFAVYSLESTDGRAGTLSTGGLSQKSTFCIRDSEPIDLAHPGANKGASYTICGKERQGISPGWADSYYYTYVDQKFDVTDLPEGEYKVKIVINPLDRFKEITKDNNVGETIFNLDVKNNTVKVISEKNYGI